MASKQDVKPARWFQIVGVIPDWLHAEPDSVVHGGTVPDKVVLELESYARTVEQKLVAHASEASRPTYKLEPHEGPVAGEPIQKCSIEAGTSYSVLVDGSVFVQGLWLQERGDRLVQLTVAPDGHARLRPLPSR